MPMLGIFYGLMNAALDSMGTEAGIAVAVGLVIAFGLSQFVVLLLVQSQVRPNRINQCKKCGTTNRILPFMRRLDLQCASCSTPLYGAWPIKDLQLLSCSSCKTDNTVESDQMVEGIPNCSNCNRPLAMNAKYRSG